MGTWAKCQGRSPRGQDTSSIVGERRLRRTRARANRDEGAGLEDLFPAPPDVTRSSHQSEGAAPTAARGRRRPFCNAGNPRETRHRCEVWEEGGDGVGDNSGFTAPRRTLVHFSARRRFSAETVSLTRQRVLGSAPLPSALLLPPPPS
ncbi:hypothetical protein chiPu_0019716 [Chiloscyllium punctatum]|uniref:Uncharacterized protein n=1 Tax=Chiloscyllium punctatum TaxID=137246 RepID=A0A401RSX7_CHIPU|nr:hypothetical protein [Chiloscyllium punctatum]